MDPTRVADFQRRGVAKEDIVDSIFAAPTRGTPVGGSGQDRVVYEVVLHGEARRFAISVSTNGYIVGAHPVLMTRKLKSLP